MNLKSEDILYISRSFIYSSAIVGELIVCLQSKIKFVISRTMTSVSVIIRNLIKFRCNILCLNPFLLSMISNWLKKHCEYITILEAVYVSGAILTVEVFKEAKKNIDIFLLRKFCMNFLSIYEIPQEFLKIDKLPRTTTGKIKRKEIYENFYRFYGKKND